MKGAIEGNTYLKYFFHGRKTKKAVTHERDRLVI